MSEQSRKLTRAEQLIWLGQRMAGDAPIYNMVLAISLQAVDPQQFAKAYQRLSATFAPLRASLRDGPDGPLLDLAACHSRPLDLLDFRGERDPKQAMRDWMSREAADPFGLEEPLCRSALLRIGDSDFVWFINQHHLITDAWSCSLLLADIDKAYH